MTDWTPSSAEPFTSAGRGNRPHNNPGNLRQPKTTTGFMQYPTPEEGRLALEQDLIAKGKRGPTTISKFLSGYSPSNENDTKALIANMAKRTGLDPDAPLDLSDPVIRAKVAHAVQIQEGYKPMDLPAATKPEPVVHTGSGRGGQGGPTAEEYNKSKESWISKHTPTASEAGTYLANIGRTITLHGTDYLVPGMTKKEVEEFYAQNEKENPKATTAGKLTGEVTQAVLLGGGATKAASGVSKLANLGKTATAATEVGTQAVTSGGQSVANYMLEHPNATKEELAAVFGTGAIWGGGAAAVGEVAKAGQKAWVGHRVKKINERSAKDVAKYNEEVVAPHNAQLIKDQAAAEKQALMTASDSGPMPTVQPKGEPINEYSLTARGAEPAPGTNAYPLMDEQGYRHSMSNYKMEPHPTQPTPEGLFSALGSSIKDETKGLITKSLPNLITGGVIGTGTYMLDDSKDPLDTWRLAKTAAGTGLGAWKGAVGARTARDLPLWYPQTAKFAGDVGQAAAKTMGIESTPYATQQPASMPEKSAVEKSLIRQTIDGFDTKETARKAPKTEWSPTSAEPWSPTSAEPAD